MAGNSKNERVSQARQQGVLLDTSLWIRYFRPRGDEKVKAQVKRSFGRAGLHLLGGEGGAFGGRKGRRGLRAAEQRFGSFGRNTHHQGSVAWGARLGYTLRRNGITVPLPDLLIAQLAISEKT
jgi:predicted nucleic acid-binding protein